jgi:hypothetical protein
MELIPLYINILKNNINTIEHPILVLCLRMHEKTKNCDKAERILPPKTPNKKFF